MENKHPQKEGWPSKIDLFPRAMAVGRFLRRLIGYLPEDSPDYMSEHYHQSEDLYEAPGSYYFKADIQNRWDDNGRYTDNDGNDVA